MLKSQAQPLHHDYWWFLSREHIKNSGDVLSSDDSEDVVFSDKTGGKSNSAGALESLDSNKFLVRFVKSFVDLAIRALSNSFEEGIFIDHAGAFHEPIYYQSIIILSIMAIINSQHYQNQ